MKRQNFITVELLFLVFIMASFTSLGDNKEVFSQADCFSMIWNQRITKRSWIYLNQDISKIYKKNSDITDGDALKMQKNYWDATYTDEETKQKFSTVDKRSASFKLVTLGYKFDEQKKNVGFDFIILNKNKNKNEPYVFRIVNNSQKENFQKLATLREVGFVFENWPQYWANENKWTGGEYSFSDNYQVEKLDDLTIKFKYRLIDFKAPLNKKLIKEKWLGSYVTCDLRFNEYDEKGKIVNLFLIGVVFSNPLGVDYNEKPSDGILFGAAKAPPNEKQILLLNGNKHGVKEVNTISSKNTFQTVEINFRPLIDKYLTVNKKNKNIITGLDIYSATRGADITYDIQDVQVTGCNRK